MLLRKHLLAGGVLILLVAVALGLIGVAWQIVSYGKAEGSVHADAALVLGAAAWGTKPSPVYRERINEAIALTRRCPGRYCHARRPCLIGLRVSHISSPSPLRRGGPR